MAVSFTDLETWLVHNANSPAGYAVLFLVVVAATIRYLAKTSDKWGPLALMAVCDKDRRADVLQLERLRRGAEIELKQVDPPLPRGSVEQSYDHQPDPPGVVPDDHSP